MEFHQHLYATFTFLRYTTQYYPPTGTRNFIQFDVLTFCVLCRKCFEAVNCSCIFTFTAWRRHGNWATNVYHSCIMSAQNSIQALIRHVVCNIRVKYSPDESKVHDYLPCTAVCDALALSCV